MFHAVVLSQPGKAPDLLGTGAFSFPAGLHLNAKTKWREPPSTFNASRLR
jgi:hypothetical protein